jgi:hypothetical protein
MHGGLKIYRGSPAAARAYVEADRARVDDYYLAEGTGLAARLVANSDWVVEMPAMDGPTYERWVAGRIVDPGLEAGRAKGRLRSDDQAVRFVEVTVNGSKTWSLAAAVDPGVAAAYDAAQDRAAHQIVAWLAEHSTTRVGPRGRQVQVPVEELEPRWCGITPPGPVTRTVTCICRSTLGSGPPVGGGVCTRWGCGTVWRRSTGSGTPR